MANQAIALQARAPQSAGLGPAIAQNAQAINMMSQQRAAERQAAQAQQTMDIEAAKEMRAAALAAPQMKKAEAEAGAAQVKYVMDFMDASALAIANVRDPQQAMAVGQRLKQLFVEPEFQQAVDETLGSIPQDPGQFEAWREDSLMRTMDAKDQLAREFKTQTTGTQQREISMPKYGRGVATEVPGSRIDVARGMTYVKDDQGNVFAMPSKSGGSFGDGGTFERMLRVESGGKQFDRNGQPLTSSAGAIGIAQVMPKTAPEAARLAGLPFDDNRYRNDPEYNRALGEAYYEKQLADFGDERLAAAAYNAGPGAVRRALQKGGPDGWINHVPAETQKYVQSVFGGGGGRGAAGGGAGPAPVISGSNTKANEALTAMEAARARYDETIEVAKRLLNNPDLDTILGNIQGNIPETALSLYSQGAANALADYNTLLTTAGFQELQAMRDASPTGGALGQVAVEENKMLQKSAFSSSRTQAEAKFKQAVRDYISRLERSRSRVVGAYERQFGERLPSSAGAKKSTPPKTSTRPAGGSTLPPDIASKYGL
jgi:hypothetical protein